MNVIVNDVPFIMIINRDYIYLVNEELNIKFRGALKRGAHYKGLPFEFIYEVINYHLTGGNPKVFELVLTQNYDKIEFSMKIGEFMGASHYYNLYLNEYFDNFNDKVISIQGQTEEYEEEIDTDREGLANSRIYEANDKLKQELLITKQEFQRLKISNYIYKKSVEKRFEDLMRQGNLAAMHVANAVEEDQPAPIAPQTAEQTAPIILQNSEILFVPLMNAAGSQPDVVQSVIENPPIVETQPNIDIEFPAVSAPGLIVENIE